MKTTHDRLSDVPRILYEDKNFARAGEGQCDCACVEAVPTNETIIPLQPATAYKLRHSLQAFPLDENNSVVMADRLRGAAVLNRNALTIARFFHHPQRFSDMPDAWCEAWGAESLHNTIDQMLRLRLLVPKGYVEPPLAEATETLTAWLHITDRCNLRCTYCYLPHKREDMPVEVGRAAIDATFRSAVQHGYKNVKLKYAGGEPLILFSNIVELHRYAQELATEYDMSLDGVVLSNGTLLTGELVSNLRSLELRLMISLDGMGRFHDSQRSYAGGHGSFTDVVESVDLALSMGLVPDISITVSGRNAKGLPELMAWILKRDLPFSLNFYRENELSVSYTDLQLEEQEIIDGMLAAFSIIEENLPRRSLLASLVDRANLASPHLRTCGVGHSYLVFDYRGRIAKCQMQMHKTVADVTVADPLDLVRNDETGIQNISVNHKEGCRDCEWKNWCTGGCPLATYRATGRYDIQSPNCNIYKSLYPEVVRLEGLRLLEYACWGDASH